MMRLDLKCNKTDSMCDSQFVDQMRQLPILPNGQNVCARSAHN